VRKLAVRREIGRAVLVERRDPADLRAGEEGAASAGVRCASSCKYESVLVGARRSCEAIAEVSERSSEGGDDSAEQERTHDLNGSFLRPCGVLPGS